MFTTRVNRDTDAPSTISLATTRSSIVQVFMENVAPTSSTGPQNSEIGGAAMVPATFGVDPWPTLFPTTSANAPAYTNTRLTRVFGREVYNDLAIVWNLPGYGVSTTLFTSNDLLIIVSWPAGVGQAFRTPYPAGSTILRVRYNAIP